MLAGVDVWGAMEATIVVPPPGYIVAYVLVCVAAPVFLRRIGELTAGSALTAIVAAVGLSGEPRRLSGRWRGCGNRACGW